MAARNLQTAMLFVVGIIVLMKWIYIYAGQSVLDTPRENTGYDVIYGGSVHIKQHVKSGNGSIPPCSNSERIKHLRRMCAEYDDPLAANQDDPEFYERLMLDETHKLIYCVNCKVGSSSIKTLLRNLSHSAHALEAPVADLRQLEAKANLTMMNHLPLAEIKRKLRSPDYTRFFVTRNPLSRLVSAYRNIIVKTVYNYHVYKGMLAAIRPGVEFKLTDRPTWSEFVEYLPSERSDDDEFNNNKHWRRQVDVCHPCVIDYDYVMKLDTLSHDFKPILRAVEDELKNINMTELPFLRVSSSNQQTLAEIDELPQRIVDKLVKRYEDDLRLFGYHIDEDRRLSCAMHTDSGVCC